MKENLRASLHIDLPEDVKYIIDTIEKAGYEAYAVGGCIRDCLLGKEPQDYDITTSALPQEIKGLFRRTIDTGIQHGTVTVMLKDKGYEITTYRVDGKYEDNRHPSSVEFTRSLEEDLKRRDFTINAMAYNDKQGLVDLFGGCGDLNEKTVRCVGIPEERFKEDALRIMRAARFSAQLGYSIEEETKEAMKKLSKNLKDISSERIQTELVKLLTGEHPENIRIMYECGMTAVFMPEFDRIMNTNQNHPHHCYSVGEHTIKAVEVVRNDKYLRLAMLFHDMGKPAVKITDEKGIDHFHGHGEISKKIAMDILKRLKFDNDTINTVSKLVFYHDVSINPEAKAVRRRLSELGQDIFPLVLEVKRADILAQSMYKRDEKLNRLEELNRIYNDIIKQGDCFLIKDLAVNGRDLIQVGYLPGSAMGEELNELLLRVLDDPTLNNKDTLLKLAVEDLK